MRSLLLVGGALSVVAITGLAAVMLRIDRRATPALTDAVDQSTIGTGTELPIYWNVPQFSYLDQNSQRITPQDLRGHVWIADFIFTQCTSICPVMTAKMVMLQQQLADPDLRFVSFSVDPEHDTPDALKKYAAEWNANESRWHLLATENQQKLQETVKAMKVSVQPTGDKDNPIMHTNLFMLVDEQGRVRGAYNSGDSEAMDRLVQHAIQLTGQSTQAASLMMSDGQAIFTRMGCAACHNNPRLAPSLNGVAGRMVHLDGGGTTTADDAYLRQSIVDPPAQLVAGYGPTMPAYGRFLSAAQVQQLVEYLHTLKAPEGAAPAAAARSVRDPVCGMKVTVTADTPHAAFNGTEYYFCSDDCQGKFEKNPSRYAKPASTKPADDGK